MVFKRVRLRPASPLVNAGLAAAVIFLGACSGSEDETPSASTDQTSPETPEAPENTVILPAVWNTDPLHAPVTDIAFAGGSTPIMLALFEDGTAQVFDLNAERLTEPAPLDVALVTSGIEQAFGADTLSVFPALDPAGAPQLVVFTPALPAPSVIALNENLNDARGLCIAETPDQGTSFSFSAILEQAEDNTSDPNAYGHIIVTEDEEFDILPASAPAVTRPYTECDYRGPPAGDTALLRQGDQVTELQLTPFGTLVSKPSGADIGTPITIRDGITVRASKAPTAIATLSEVRFGNYPSGIIAVAGPLENGEHRIALIEPEPLFDGG
ncbi:MAG: hypothetical protein AAFY34_13490 [Pseudomonadota bacterium]